MGNQQSTTSTINDTINKAVSNVLMSSSSNCAQNNSSNQTISVSNIHANNCGLNVSGISQTSTQTPNFTCSSDSQNSADLQNQFKTQLQQQAESQVKNLGGALNSQAVSSAVNTLTNSVENNINISQVSSCVQNNIASQNIQVNGVTATCPGYCTTGCPTGYTCDLANCSVNITDISQNLTQAAVGSCLATNKSLASAVTTAANSISQSASSTNSGIDIVSLLSSFGTFYIAIIVGIVVICLASLSSSIASALSGGGQEASSNLSAAVSDHIRGFQTEY